MFGVVFRRKVHYSTVGNAFEVMLLANASFPNSAKGEIGF